MLRNLYPENYIRFRSPEKSIEFISTFLSRYPDVDNINFMDDILALNMEWFSEFCKLYKREIGLPYTCSFMVNVFSGETARLLADSGCYEVRFGVESGNEDYRKKYLKRFTKNQKIIDSFMCCKEFGISTKANMMVGLPHETMNNMLEGVVLCSKLDPAYIQVATFFPTPSTELYNVSVRDGLFDVDSEMPDEPWRPDIPTVLKQTSIRPEQVKFIQLYYHFLVRMYSLLPEKMQLFMSRIISSGFFPFKFFISLGNILKLVGKSWAKARFALKVPAKRYKPRRKKK